MEPTVPRFCMLLLYINKVWPRRDWRGCKEEIRMRKSFIRVFNAVRSSEGSYRTIEGKSPLQWWKSKRDYPEDAKVRCSQMNCNKEATDGSHVIDMKTGQRLYIVPLCHMHNEAENSFFVSETRLMECTGIERQGELVEINSKKYKGLKVKKEVNKITFDTNKKNVSKQNLSSIIKRKRPKPNPLGNVNT